MHMIRKGRAQKPTSRVTLEENANAEMELTQLGGIDEAKRLNEATLGPGSSLLNSERIMTDQHQYAKSRNDLDLSGEASRANTRTSLEVRLQGRTTCKYG
jgi:hypothetical protein